MLSIAILASVLIREFSCHKSVDPESVIFIQFTRQAARKRSRIGIEISVGEPKSLHVMADFCFQ